MHGSNRKIKLDSLFSSGWSRPRSFCNFEVFVDFTAPSKFLLILFEFRSFCRFFTLEVFVPHPSTPGVVFERSLGYLSDWRSLVFPLRDPVGRL